MSSLQQLLDRRKADQPAAAQLCHAVHPQASALSVVTSADERWIFPWHHLVAAQHVRANEREELRLTFTSHLVTLRGRNLTALADLVATAQLASLRVAPSKYGKAGDAEPFVDSLHVAAHPDEARASPSGGASQRST
jgi:hypothetical protein